MSKKTFYKQCRMSKKLENGTNNQVSWIPEEYAIIGKVLKLRNEDKIWENGWVIDSVGERQESSDILDSHDIIKSHRKATGDSLPKNTKKV